jgi:hypothetical protein
MSRCAVVLNQERKCMIITDVYIYFTCRIHLLFPIKSINKKTAHTRLHKDISHSHIVSIMNYDICPSIQLSVMGFSMYCSTTVVLFEVHSTEVL